MGLKTGNPESLKSFNDFTSRYLRSNHPYSASIEVTYLCNLRCTFCYNPTHEAISELTTEQMIYALDQLKKLGVLKLVFTGGECLARPDIFTLIDEAQKRQFMITLFSNAALIDREMADRILDSSVHRLETSLHGACAKTHDKQTCVKGSFDRIIQALEYFKDTHIEVVLKTTVTRSVQDELWDIKAIADKFGYQSEFDMSLSPRSNGDTSPLEQAPTDEFRRYFWSKECDPLRGKDGTKPREYHGDGLACTSGRGTLLIDPWGNMFPCVQWRESFGNIIKDDIVEAWEGSSVLNEVRDATVRIPKETLPEGKKAYSNFCAGIARSAVGSPMAIYESEDRNMEIRYERAVLEGRMPPLEETDKAAVSKK